MGFGLSFGKKKQSSSGTSTIDKTTDLTGVQDSTKQTSGQSTTTNSGTTSNTTQQQGATNNTQDSRTIGQTSNTTQGTTQTLSQDIQDALADKVKSVLSGGITDANIATLSNAIGGAADFNVDSFVSGIVGNARNRGEQQLQEQNSAFASQVGGVADTNSMAALLASRGRNDLESSLAAVEAATRAQGEGIRNQGINTAISAQSGLAGIAEALSGTLKGANTVTDMTQLGQELQQLIGKTTGLSNTTGTEVGQQESTSSTSQLLNEIAQILTDQTQTEKGTETQKTKGKSGGFGLSLGL